MSRETPPAPGQVYEWDDEMTTAKRLYKLGWKEVGGRPCCPEYHRRQRSET